MPIGDLATWFTGIITFFLFIIGFIQINNERKARNKSEDDAVLRRNREQAEQISSWLIEERHDEHETWVTIQNLSPQPIYQVIVSVEPLSETGKSRQKSKHIICVGIVPPGKGYVIVHDVTIIRRQGIEIAFQDIIGKNWIRNANGELEELKVPTTQHYDVTLPTSWQGIRSELPNKSPII